LNVSTGHPSGKMLVTGEAQLNALEISPSADVTVRWAQFADGTTFGDEKFASETLDLRKATYTTLAHLNHVYQAEEPARFLQELQSGTGSGEVDALSRPFVTSWTTDGKKITTRDGKEIDKQQRELEAEATAYTVCSYCGIQSPSDFYLAALQSDSCDAV
jgi:hypothetical protein